MNIIQQLYLTDLSLSLSLSLPLPLSLSLSLSLHYEQSLSSWNTSDATCLSRLVEELLAEYRQHHRLILSPHQRLLFELNTLLEHNQQYNVDVHCTLASNVHVCQHTQYCRSRLVFTLTLRSIACTTCIIHTCTVCHCTVYLHVADKVDFWTK